MIKEGFEPAWWKDRPVMPAVATWAREAFSQLSTCRVPIGAAMGPIPWTAIDQYAKRYGIEGRAFERLVQAVTTVDVALMEFYSRRNKKGP